MASQRPPDPLYVIRSCKSPVTALLFTLPDSSLGKDGDMRLVSGTQNGRIDIWDLKTWRSLYGTDVHDGSAVLSLYERPEKPGLLLSQGRDGCIQEIDLRAQTVSKNEGLTSTAFGFCRICWTRMNNELVVLIPCGNTSQLDVFSFETCKKIASLSPKNAKAYGMCMSIQELKSEEDTVSIVVGYEDGSLSVWDLRTARELDHISLYTEPIMAMDYHPGVCKGASGSANDQVILWSVTENHETQKLKEIIITNPGISCLNFRNDGKLFVTGGWDGKVRAFGGKKGTPLAVLDYHKQTVQCTAFSPDGLLSAGGKDNHISFWSLYR